jgi:hypothetical protein
MNRGEAENIVKTVDTILTKILPAINEKQNVMERDIEQLKQRIPVTTERSRAPAVRETRNKLVRPEKTEDDLSPAGVMIRRIEEGQARNLAAAKQKRVQSGTIIHGDTGIDPNRRGTILHRQARFKKPRKRKTRKRKTHRKKSRKRKSKKRSKN